MSQFNNKINTSVKKQLQASGYNYTINSPKNDISGLSVSFNIHTGEDLICTHESYLKI